MTSRAFGAPASVAAAHRDRLRRAAAEASGRGVDALLITPSPDYTYLLGYAPPAMERLTCLIVPADGSGYDLTLHEGWKIVAGAREGDKTITR